MTRRCGTCEFYFGDVQKAGDCRRYAPHPSYLGVNHGTDVFWPRVQSVEFCGEWQPAPNEAALPKAEEPPLCELCGTQKTIPCRACEGRGCIGCNRTGKEPCPRCVKGFTGKGGAQGSQVEGYSDCCGAEVIACTVNGAQRAVCGVCKMFCSALAEPVICVPWKKPISPYDSERPTEAARFEFTLAGVSLAVCKTNEAGITTGRDRFCIFCATCGIELHKGTTGPRSRIASHLREKHGFKGQVKYEGGE